MVKSVIDNVSDTARWVAEYRARESARPDALFRDPLATGLAGERGRVIAEAAKRSFGNGWFFIARTKLIDDLIERSLAEGCDRVVNLAAGLDTRPYRLQLPPSLEWIEVDLPGIIEEKNRLLADESPRCKLSRVPVDLTDVAARRGCLIDATKGAAKTLVITEGLLLYLAESEVHELTTELKRPEIAWWVADIIGPAILKMSSRASRTNNAPVIFGPENGIAFFERAGWTVDRFASQLPAAAQWNRLSPVMRIVARLPKGNPRRPGRSLWSAVVRLTP
ncbi:class I SAM-dependent methyltransferase [Streptomyces sp. NA02950]|uniref:class I SAM-dependent methyltransferase n=1 Tax=Streptomyces sp. NA02950 TaxID=2742137 RepID=UPI001591EEB2|nr:SAM-dependent methyltransferase [Streptomyces sp. NA02950]QKV96538.1 class I SAM-dependent methyltransferase [Streptomyces sp. NA02950]